MYRMAICEDEANLRGELWEKCQSILTELGVEHELTAFACAEELEAALAAAARFDVLLLDILLGGKSGMELARQLRARDDRVSIIFTTSAHEYLPQGYAVQPIQFLLKPVDRDELATALRTDLKLNHSPKTVSLSIGQRTVILPVDEICYAESQNHNVTVHLKAAARSFPISISELERLLPTDRFCRCHNSFLVNMSHIAEIARNELTLRGGARVPVGRKYYTQAQSAFIRYINQ